MTLLPKKGDLEPWQKFLISKGAYYKALSKGKDLATIKPRLSPRTEIYRSLRLAKKAVKSLGIKTKEQYRFRYCEDPYLPSRPDLVYPDFKNWGDFLGTGRTRRKAKDCYSTWKQAGRVARKLGCQSSTGYRDEYKRDSKLPRNPDQIYSDFPGWDEFLARRSK